MPRNARTAASSALSSPMSRRLFLGTTGALSLGAALTACGGGGSGSSSGSAEPVGRADIDKAMKTPTELTFWTWVPNIAKEIALFEKKYPAVKVKVVNAGQGTPQYTKLRTALKAGSGAPDLVQMEYQAIPTFTITDSLLDLRPYGAAELKDRFVDWTWGQVSGGDGEVWAIPQDTGPMGLLYRKDIFDKHGIEVPGTGTSSPRRHASSTRPTPTSISPISRPTSLPPGTDCCGRRAPSRTPCPAGATSPSASTTPSPGSSAGTGAGWRRRA